MNTSIVLLMQDIANLMNTHLNEAGAGDPGGSTELPAGPDVKGWLGDLEARMNMIAGSPDELLRLACDCELSVVHSVALLLKQEWQGQFTSVLDVEDGDEQAFLSYVSKNLAHLRQQYQPDTRKHYQRLEDMGGLASGAGYNHGAFAELCRELIRADLHLLGIQSPELEAFGAREAMARGLLGDATTAQREAFIAAKSSWLQQQDELAEGLLVLEQRRLENANIVREWMALFGAEYMALQEHVSRLELAQMRMELAKAQPELAREAIEELVAEVERERNKVLAALRAQVALAPRLAKIGGGAPADVDLIADMRADCKRLLRQLWALLHPDKLHQHPAYGELTEQQRKQLAELWHACMEIRAEELGFASDSLGSQYRSRVVLQNALDTARAVLTAAGIDTDVNLIIQGDTLELQLQWLAHAVESLQQDLALLQVELKALLDDRDVQEKIAMLSMPADRQAQLRSEMRTRAEACRAQADDLECRLNVHFDTLVSQIHSKGEMSDDK